MIHDRFRGYFVNKVDKEAVSATARHRGTSEEIADVKTLLELIEESSDLRQMWEKYRRDFKYAADISYEQVNAILYDMCAALL